ncbi:thiamine pyrophosphate-binding protein [Aquabacterium sp. J223]|uniref:thiamine pyrophosphate-binding protein n=1 Tax=Aquabacterium sp. J223 TaxID=2898431 RepID=UPI0021AD8666|nr:thiamine pyrophosphate-binding protein [Aquabacterium sp. J223]UUX95290.1 thiamine pyrophosphate-binding protein [Aquabacterium sp. J223]
MKVTGAELIVRSLIACGVDTVFNVPGFGIHPLLDAIRRHRQALAYYCGPSESAVALMADGYGRLRRKPAFVNVYHASGTALGLIGVTTAWADRSPMLFTSTTTSRKLARSDGYASVPGDVTEMSRQFCKWSWEVPTAERIPEAIARAVRLASTPPMGPVHLAFPGDLYSEEVDEAVLATALRAAQASVYTGAMPEPAGLSEALALLRAARRPVVIAGGEVAQREAVAELVGLAEACSAAVFGEPYVAYMGFPNAHPRFVGRFSGRAALVNEADLVVVAGAELTGGSGAPLQPPASAKQLLLTHEPVAVGKQVWPDVALVADLRHTLAALRAGLQADPGASRVEWAQHTSAAQAAWRASLPPKPEAPRPGPGPVGMPALVAALERAFGDDVVLVDHATTGTPYLLDVGDFSHPERYFGISGRASAQGWGVPAAIGMQVAAGKRRVVNIVGDGGFMFTGNALYAAALWRLPMVFIVLANGGWYDVAYGARVNRGWTDEDIRHFGWTHDPPIDFAGLARSLGLTGLRAADEASLEDALATARAAQGPVLIEVDADPVATEYYLSFISR